MTVRSYSLGQLQAAWAAGRYQEQAFRQKQPEKIALRRVRWWSWRRMKLRFYDWTGNTTATLRVLASHPSVKKRGSR